MKRLVLTVLLVFFVGCGGSSGTDNQTPSGDNSPSTQNQNAQNNDTVLIGTFVDAPVEGLKYETETLSGFTDNQGRFKYKDGETVTFKIGNLTLGSVIGNHLITPLTLTNENDLNNISQKATNIARLLQSLDDNSSNNALIKIPSSLKDLDVLTTNFESDADLGTILLKAQTITSKTYTLKDAIIAKADMIKYIRLYKKYEMISAGYYSGTGIKYYLLMMPSDGNIQVDTANSANIYDINLNPLNISNDNDNNFKKVTYLPAGSYIIKVNYWQPSSKFKTITINSPVLFNQNNLDKITAGTTSGIGIKYYLLTMPSDGNIQVDTANSANIYDINLNPLNISNDNDNNFKKVTYLPAGSYIIKVNYWQPSSKFKTITINSPLLD